MSTMADEVQPATSMADQVQPVPAFEGLVQPATDGPESAQSETDTATARVRTLTEKGQSESERQVERHMERVEAAWAQSRDALDVVLGSQTSDELKSAERTLQFKYGDYRNVSRDFSDYLQRTRSIISKTIFESHIEQDRRRDFLVNSSIERVKQSVEFDKNSVRSSQRNKRSSGTAGYAAKSRAKAEAAKAKIKFAEEEARIKKQMLNLEIYIQLLKEKKECAAAEAEASTFDEFETVDKWEEGDDSARSPPSLVEDRQLRTEQFVRSTTKSEPDNVAYADIHDTQSVKQNTISTRNENIEGNANLKARDTNRKCRTVNEVKSADTSTPFVDVANFLLKKDLIVSRFQRYDDDPSRYHVWKSSLQNVMKEIIASPQEELELLTNFLGPEYSKQALTIRAASSSNRSSGLKKIWDRLDQRYGSPELIDRALKKKLSEFPPVSYRNKDKLYELSDNLAEIQSYKEDPMYSSLLSYFDTSVGVNPIVAKLPPNIQNKWVDRASRYKESYTVAFPPFSFFVKFVKEIAKTMNDPSFSFESNYAKFSKEEPKPTQLPRGQQIFTRKTEVKSGDVTANECPMHAGSSHPLVDCRIFLQKTLPARKQFLRDNKICYRCCLTTSHIAKDCKAAVKCTECNSTKHPSALHPSMQIQGRDGSGKTPYGGEYTPQPVVKCTEVCGEGISGRSCAKTVLVKIFSDGFPEKSITAYAILDDQSNCTLATTELLDSLGVDGREVHYELASCAGLHQSSGRKVHGLRIQSVDELYELQLPTVFECNNISQDRSEIATPDIARHFPHLKKIADHIPPLATGAQISLLIGRDVVEAHQVQEQVVGPRAAPFAQRLGFGWVIIGDVCLGKVHCPRDSDMQISAYKTYMVDADRASIFKPCLNNMNLKEIDNDDFAMHHDSLFRKTKDDEKVGLSIEDRMFLRTMEEEVEKTADGHWIAPLPFRMPKQELPNNRQMALKRALILDSSLRRNTEKREHFVSFMDKVLKSEAAEVAPEAPEGCEKWYLPIFGVYHPHKPGKIRGVFDSSASFKGVSLNGNLLSGPNLTNSLIGILLKFRQDEYAVAADIEQMFYAFLVKEEHRNYLRFFWYRENNPTLDLIEYRMKAHVFGNSPSPAVAAYCLRKSVEKIDVYGKDVKDFVEDNFYVDDGLKSLHSVADAVSLVKRTQETLQKEGRIRLHKIISNSPEIMSSFPEEDLGKQVESIDLKIDASPTHHSLGISWSLVVDAFKFNIQLPNNPVTRRGMLSTLNSIYDPLGFVAPIVIEGKILMREVTAGADWDERLDPQVVQRWTTWTEALQSLDTVSVPRMYIDQSLTTSHKPELHIFSYASEKAVSAVAFMRVETSNMVKTGFVMGKSKVAPTHGNTIPRLELCAALLATQVAEIIIDSLDVSLEKIAYYTDSKVVLGYLSNRTRRFYNYVSNRVHRILSVAKSEQWSYIPTHENPADCGSRNLCSTVLLKEKWLAAPVRMQTKKDCSNAEVFPLVEPENDKEIRLEVFKSNVRHTNLIERFEKFSEWKRLLSALSLLKRAVRRKATEKEHIKSSSSPTCLDYEVESKQMILKQVQRNAFPDECQCLDQGKQVSKRNSIASLRPYQDKDGLMRIGGRLNQSCFPIKETNPVILPAKSHIALLIARYFHEKTKHQGRLLTEAAVRSGGYWIVGAKRLVSSLIHSCVKCRKLRGPAAQQLMADLPADRLTPGPPFTFVGVDVFGPYSIVTRRTRGGSACSKRWGILFTCLTTRSVHIEVVEEMSSSSFINALRRFIAIRGNVKQFRSDRGTNFVGAIDSLQINAVNVEDKQVTGFLHNAEVTWLFNPPHSSHMGGVWERMIGLTGISWMVSYWTVQIAL